MRLTKSQINKLITEKVLKELGVSLDTIDYKRRKYLIDNIDFLTNNFQINNLSTPVFKSEDSEFFIKHENVPGFMSYLDSLAFNLIHYYSEESF